MKKIIVKSKKNKIINEIISLKIIIIILLFQVLIFIENISYLLLNNFILFENILLFIINKIKLIF